MLDFIQLILVLIKKLYNITKVYQQRSLVIIPRFIIYMLQILQNQTKVKTLIKNLRVQKFYNF